MVEGRLRRERERPLSSIGAAKERKFDVDEKDRAILSPSRAADINAIKLGRRWSFALRHRAALGDSCGCEDSIRAGVRVVCERVGVSGGGTGAWADFWAELDASLAGGSAHGDKIFAASVGGGSRIRDESARGAARGAEWIRVHGGEHCVRVDGGIAGGGDAGGEQDGFDIDNRGDGDLRGKRDCGGSADHSCRSGGNGGFARNGFYFERDCAADFSSAGMGATFVAAAIRIVGGAGDP